MHFTSHLPQNPLVFGTPQTLLNNRVCDIRRRQNGKTHLNNLRTCLNIALIMATCGMSACSVVSLAGSAAGAAISVGGAVVSTGVTVTGKVIGAGVDAATGGATTPQ